jgi:CubicO group peptidase (beta-lactamase class C family)
MTAASSSAHSSVKKLALSLLFCLPSVALAQGNPPIERFPAELDAYIRRTMTTGSIPGLAIGIVRNDSVLVARGYGIRELGKEGRVTPNTVFDIASLAKSFTSTAAAILIDRGLLAWDDPVRKYLPDLQLPTEELTATASVRDFLSHGTGLEAVNMMWVPTAVNRAEVLRRMRYVPVRTPPHQFMIYSNIGYSVAGEAIAAAGRTSFDELLRDVVIKPLGLMSTTWTYDQAAGMPDLASSHVWIDGRQVPIRREFQRQSIAPAAAVQSSVTDLARWMRLHLNNGTLDGKRYVSDSTMRAMHSIQTVIRTTPAMRAARLVQDTIGGYGLGWQVMDYRGHPLVWHTGNGDGQIAYMALLPRDRFGVVVLVNTWVAPNIHMALVNRVLDTYLGFPPRDWAAEFLAGVPAALRAQDSARVAMVAMRSSLPPPLPLPAYVGRYESALYGPLHVRFEGTELTLQMGDGQLADLEYHGAPGFFVRWKDAFFREYYGTHVRFTVKDDSVVGLTFRLSRDDIVAEKNPGRL